jgi:hypothetical protein
MKKEFSLDRMSLRINTMSISQDLVSPTNASSKTRRNQNPPPSSNPPSTRKSANRRLRPRRRPACRHPNPQPKELDHRNQISTRIPVWLPKNRTLKGRHPTKKRLRSRSKASRGIADSRIIKMSFKRVLASWKLTLSLPIKVLDQ